MPNINQHYHGFSTMGNNLGEFSAVDGGVTFTTYGNTGHRHWNGSGGGGGYTAGNIGAVTCVTTGANSAAQQVQPMSARVLYIVKY